MGYGGGILYNGKGHGDWEWGCTYWMYAFTWMVDVFHEMVVFHHCVTIWFDLLMVELVKGFSILGRLACLRISKVGDRRGRPLGAPFADAGLCINCRCWGREELMDEIRLASGFLRRAVF